MENDFLKDITVIIPIHTWDENVEKMLSNALQSIPNGCNLIISTVNGSGVELTNEVASSFNKFAMVFNEGDSSFQALVNNGVKNVETTWFSILEFDDEYSPIWFKEFHHYQQYNSKFNIFFPLVDIYNVEDGKDEFVGNGNEAPWASSFSDEMGVIDEQSLSDYFDFYPDGAIFKKETWDILGGLKESIKLTFWYEFMLRATHKGEKIFVIPKVGYAHNLGREDSLMMQYRATIDEKESEFWLSTAKKEAYFKEDRHPVYESNKVEDAENTNNEE